MSGDRIDRELERLGAETPPPVGDELERAIGAMEAAGPRAPRRQWLLLVGSSALYAAVLIAATGLRRDLGALPLAWLALHGAAWLVGFLGLAWWTLVPAPGEVMPRWRRCGVAAAALALGFVALGLTQARHARGLSTLYEPSPAAIAAHAAPCLRIGLLAAAVPVVLAVLLLRGAVPVRSRWVAAAVGAAAGSLGGLVLHLHCPIAERFHLGLVHGSVVLLAALAAAAIAPRWTRPR